ncbi:hypothetical protein ACFYNO_31065 [Kitasatospora sp. NPDC006697]|uniref:hypothetical protein n=1 Tax=Kitasatospora sp. NPDC006697 TaxID=3364020 RepID=UPI00368C9F02
MATHDQQKDRNDRPEDHRDVRERSAEQRDITAPTPADVRARARAKGDQEDGPEPREAP